MARLANRIGDQIEGRGEGAGPPKMTGYGKRLLLTLLGKLMAAEAGAAMHSSSRGWPLSGRRSPGSRNHRMLRRFERAHLWAAPVPAGVSLFGAHGGQSRSASAWCPQPEQGTCSRRRATGWCGRGGRTGIHHREQPSGAPRRWRRVTQGVTQSVCRGCLL